MNLETIERFRIPKRLVRATEQALRRAGEQGFELFVLWSGVAEGNVFDVRTCHVPSQTGYKLASGLCVRVDGVELHHLNRWLFEQNELLGAQVHSHPSNAYHSDTDDAFPIVTLLGGLSLVVPDFCRAGLAGEGVAAYRLWHSGWVEVPTPAMRRLLEFGA